MRKTVSRDTKTRHQKLTTSLRNFEVLFLKLLSLFYSHLWSSSRSQCFHSTLVFPSKITGMSWQMSKYMKGVWLTVKVEADWGRTLSVFVLCDDFVFACIFQCHVRDLHGNIVHVVFIENRLDLRKDDVVCWLVIECVTQGRRLTLNRPGVSLTGVVSCSHRIAGFGLDLILHSKTNLDPSSSCRMEGFFTKLGATASPNLLLVKLNTKDNDDQMIKFLSYR